MLVQGGSRTVRQWVALLDLAARSPSPAEAEKAHARARAVQERHGFTLAVFDPHVPGGGVLVDHHHVMVSGLPWWRVEVINAVAEGLGAEVVGDRWEDFTARVAGDVHFVQTFRTLYAIGAFCTALYARGQAVSLRRRVPPMVARHDVLLAFARSSFACGLTIAVREALRARVPPAALIVHPDPSAPVADPDADVQRPGGLTSEYEKFFRRPDPFGVYRTELGLGRRAALGAFRDVGRVLTREPPHERQDRQEDRAADLRGGAEAAPRLAP